MICYILFRKRKKGPARKSVQKMNEFSRRKILGLRALVSISQYIHSRRSSTTIFLTSHIINCSNCSLSTMTWLFVKIKKLSFLSSTSDLLCGTTASHAHRSISQIHKTVRNDYVEQKITIFEKNPLKKKETHHECMKWPPGGSENCSEFPNPLLFDLLRQQKQDVHFLVRKHNNK